MLMVSSTSLAENVAPTDVTIIPEGTLIGVDDKVSLKGSAIDIDDDALVYTWDFGDGTTTTGQNVKHAYNSTGEFLVTLTVNDGQGHTAMTSITLSVGVQTLPGNNVFSVTQDIPHEVPWGILVVMYIFFTGMSAGSFVLSSLGYVFGIEKYKPLAKIGIVIATVLLMVAPLFLILDLEQPLRFYTTLFRTNPTSVISWGVYLLALYPLNCMIYGWFLFREDFARTTKAAVSPIKKKFYYLLSLGKTSLSKVSKEKDLKRAKIFGTIGVPLAIAVHGYTGFLLAAIPAREVWHTALMPILFLVSAIVSGMALFIIVIMIKDRYFTAKKAINRKLVHDLGKLLAWMIVIDLMLITFEIIVLFYTGTGGSEALWLWLYGPLNASFIGVEIIIGALIPIAILLHPRLGRTILGQVTASILVLVGILAMRYNVIIGGQLIPTSGYGLLEYSVAFKDILITLGIIVLGAIMLLTALKVLPFEREERPDRIQKGKSGGLTTPDIGGRSSSQYALDGKLEPGKIKASELSDTGIERREFLKKSALWGGSIVAFLAIPKLASLASSESPAASIGREKRHAMVIDLRKCIGCNSCTQACKNEFDVPPGVWRSWVMKIKKKRGLKESHNFLPRLCNHCDNPPCVKVCPVQATYKSKDGSILQHYDKCIGCKYCVIACPYNARFIHPKMKVVDKCTFCTHKAKKGQKPSCVTACPAKARTFGDLNDPNSEVSGLIATQPFQVLKPELGTDPMVYYIGADQTILRSGLVESHE
jgi:tetrathionate reductase subunit C